MSLVQLFAVTTSGPQPVHLQPKPTSIHDLPEELPYGVYTAFRTFEHNKFLGLEDHIARLKLSLTLLKSDYEFDETLLRYALHEVCTQYPHSNARVRVDVLSDTDAKISAESRCLITLAPFSPIPDVYYQNGVALGLAPHLRRQEPRAKSADFVLQRRQYPLDAPDAFDYLLVDESGSLLEGTSSNFYAVRQGTVWTAGANVLEGIARKIVLQLISEIGTLLRLDPITLSEVEQCDEAFLSSSSRGIVPVISIGGQMVGPGRPGPITRQLMGAYEAYVAEAIRPAVGDA